VNVRLRTGAYVSDLIHAYDDPGGSNLAGFTHCRAVVTVRNFGSYPQYEVTLEPVNCMRCIVRMHQ